VAVVILIPERHWECPSCRVQHVTRIQLPHVPMHQCRAKALMLVPYVEVPPGQSELKKGAVTHRVIERGDYIGSERGIRHDAEGRAVMAVHTERADGSHDTHVFAPAARLDAVI
jgi:hypothetical protein